MFTQGNACTHALYIQEGGLRLSVVNEVGKEAVMAILGPGDFVGEECISGLPFRMSTATAIIGTSALIITEGKMTRALRCGADVFRPLHLLHAFAEHSS